MGSEPDPILDQIGIGTGGYDSEKLNYEWSEQLNYEWPYGNLANEMYVPKTCLLVGLVIYILYPLRDV